MSNWSLEALLSGLHDEIQRGLERARTTLAHPGTKGDASEKIWIKLLNGYLPKRYQAASAHVVDSNGNFSDQIDIVVFDQQYSPFIFENNGNIIIPAESVYAVFEAKQTINAAQVEYAHNKIASVRRLHRTSLPIPHAGGTYPPKPLIPILGGILTLESDWSPCIGDALLTALSNGNQESRIDIGCVASHGYFHYDHGASIYETLPKGKPATAFLFKLIEKLQFSGTVPMIDIQAYARWLI